MPQNLDDLSTRITACTSCELRRGCRSPVPPIVPGIPSQIAVLGEAPGSSEDRAGKPFVGAAGYLYRDLMRKVGINPDFVAWTNAAMCYPATHKAPTHDHLHACRHHRWESLVIAEPQYILVTGATALSTIRPDLRISKVHGRPLVWYRGEHVDGRLNHWADRVVLWPVYHPAACLNTRNPSLKADLQDDLQQLVFRIRGGWEAFRDTWPEDCWECGREVEHIDSMGVGVCDRHWQKQLSLIEGVG